MNFKSLFRRGSRPALSGQDSIDVSSNTARREEAAVPTLMPPKPVSRVASPLNGTDVGLPGSDLDLLARVSEDVNERLDANTALSRIKTSRIDMFVMPHFMSPEECAHMQGLIDAGAKPSTALKSNAAVPIRTSHTCRFPKTHDWVSMIDKRLSDLVGIDNAFSETVQGQRYHEGQYFKVHNDYVVGGNPIRKHLPMKVASARGRQWFTSTM
jgi:hypothetical protein